MADQAPGRPTGPQKPEGGGGGGGFSIRTKQYSSPLPALMTPKERVLRRSQIQKVHRIKMTQRGDGKKDKKPKLKKRGELWKKNVAATDLSKKKKREGEGGGKKKKE